MREALTYDDVLLVPREGVLEKREYADISSWLIRNHIKLAVPIIAAPMSSVTEEAMAIAMAEIGGLGVIHRFTGIARRIDMIKAIREKGPVACVAIGIHDTVEDIEIFESVGAEVFCLDVAHAHHKQIGKFLENVKKYTAKPFIAGNVATAEGARFLVEHGADAVKVGIGPGAACITRETTGFGVPQLTAVMDVAEALDGTNATIIADGGIKNSGDIVKALAAGADSVMIGSLLAGCDEAPLPGEYFGMASKRVNGHNAPEGIEGQVVKTGPAKNTIKKLAWGIRSGISYSGGVDIGTLRENAEFVRITPFGSIESGTRLS